MTNSQRDKLFQEAQEWINRHKSVFRLSDWNIDFQPDGAEEGALADNTVNDESQNCVIRLHADWYTLDEQKRRQVLCHELIHCHQDRINQVIDLARAHMTGPSWDILSRVFQRELEIATDNMGELVAAFLPRLGQK